MYYTSEVRLPQLLHSVSGMHEQGSILDPHTLQSRALKDHVAFDAITNAIPSFLNDAAGITLIH